MSALQPHRKRYWLTPPEKREEWESEFGPFDFDPCPHPCPEGFDGLSDADWPGESIYGNIPFCASDEINGRGPTAWARKAILNVACSGTFSSDRTIMEYANDIWNLTRSPVL